MNQAEKDASLNAATREAVERVAKTLQIEPTLDSVRPAMELAMGSNQMKIYKISLYFANEADRCFEQKAYFASCLLTAAANEAFLTLTCMQDEKGVKSTAVFRGLMKPTKGFLDIVGDLSVDKLVRISTELGWIPVNVVNAELLEAMIQDFPKLAQTVYPKWNEVQTIEKMQAIRHSPGPEMLRVMQDMRNLVHAPRWLKNACVLDDSEFSHNCKLAIVVGREILQCLVLKSQSTFQSSLEQLRKFEDMPNEVQAKVRELLLSRQGAA